MQIYINTVLVRHYQVYICIHFVMDLTSNDDEPLLVDLRSSNGSQEFALVAPVYRQEDIAVETIRLPRNYTLFMNELKRFTSFGGGVDGSGDHGGMPHNRHGMTDAEYDRFVSDMWIGIALTMLMVFIVFALCFWYMYHKFQQWKRSCKLVFCWCTCVYVCATFVLSVTVLFEIINLEQFV